MQNERKVVELNLSDVLPNRFQPRIKFDENAINELALSIRKYGVIQPIVVRQIGNKYEIIAGERRYKASKVAGKQTIPAIISELNDKDSVEIALIENVQRENLTPIEKAVSYKKILDMGYISQEELAKKIGKSQSAIANTLRLLNLSDDVQEALLENKISERHARSLLKIKNEKQQLEMLNRIINERLTVRKTDEEIDKMLNEDLKKPEEVVQIPDTALNDFSNPGFSNIEYIESNAQDINKPEKPKTDINQLLYENKTVEQPKIEENTNKFFNFFDNQNSSYLDESNEDDQFKLENIFNNNFNEQTRMSPNEVSTMPDITPSSPEKQPIEVPTMPDITPSSPEKQPIDVPTMPNITPSSPEKQPIEVPTMPDITPSSPEKQPIEVPTMPDITPSSPEIQPIDVPTMPDITPSSPAIQPIDVPTMPNITPVSPEIQLNEVPTMPNITPSSPEIQPIDVPTMPDITPSSPEIQLNEVPTMSDITPSSPEIQPNEVSTMPDITPSSPEIQLNEVPTMSDITPSSPEISTTDVPIKNQSEQGGNSTIKLAVPNMRIAVNTIRECENTLEKYGFTVDVEEIDFEDSYQVIFKIEK